MECESRRRWDGGRLVGKVQKGRETMLPKWELSEVSHNGFFLKAYSPQTSFKQSQSDLLKLN